MKYNNIFMHAVCIVASFVAHTGRSEYYTAISEMEKLLNTEEEIVNTLDRYLKHEERRLEKVKWLRKQYVKLQKSASKDVGQFLSNPVNAYLLVKRLTADWKTAINLSEGSDSRAIIHNVTSEELNFPTDEDLSGAGAALIRLQEIYLLDTATIARGQIKGTTPSTELTASDCFELGRHAYKFQNFKNTLLWMQESMQRAVKEEIQTVDKTEILEYMAYAYFDLKNYTAAVEVTEQIIGLDPYHPNAADNLMYYQIYTAQEARRREKGDNGQEESPVAVSLPKHGIPPVIRDAYERLCRGESLKTPEEQSKLLCYYTTNNNSYLLLQPVKVEVLNLQPRIVMYFDIIKEWEANVIKSLAAPNLERATVNNGKGGHDLANYRISKSSWLEDYDHPLIPHLNQRIEDVTGMDTTHSESLHVINYGIGGHYEPHIDFAKAGEKVSFYLGTGNRMATWIFYLSEIPAGGSTVFPDIGVEVKPVKGAAVFWNNLYRNGSGDMFTSHAACPVLAGSKWIANKWLHEAGNEFKRPCSLDPFE